MAVEDGGGAVEAGILAGAFAGVRRWERCAEAVEWYSFGDSSGDGAGLEDGQDMV